jgi:hypothetical protein
VTQSEADSLCREVCEATKLAVTLVFTGKLGVRIRVSEEWPADHGYGPIERVLAFLNGRGVMVGSVTVIYPDS